MVMARCFRTPIHAPIPPALPYCRTQPPDPFARLAPGRHGQRLRDDERRATDAASEAIDIASEAVAEVVPVTRYGRYTLVELAPTAAQHDLLLQVVDVEVPGTLGATVGDALRHLVLRSGYRLCDEQSADLLALPLPAAHYRLGPVLLRDALLTLAGPAWDLQVDDGERKVCFIRRLRELIRRTSPSHRKSTVRRSPLR